MLSAIKLMFRAVFWKRRRRAMYVWDIASMGVPPASDGIVHYCDRKPLSVSDDRLFRRRLGWLWLITRWQVAKGWIDLLLIHRSGDAALSATGMVRSWTLYRRELRWLGEPGAILGPYWTHPEDRGRGLYPRLLLASVAIAAEKGYRCVYVFADVENTASRRGIEKAGFRPMGCYQMTSVLCGMFRWHRRMANLGQIRS
jgi:RimJ/RimL family protein N-acetyltransferase